MAQAIMSNTGTNTNKNMRMGIIYTVGVGYVKITGMYGCRYDSYNTSGSPCTVYTNGANGINIAGAHNKDIGTFRPNSSKNESLTNASYWKSWGAGPTIYTSDNSLTLKFTFACSNTANIANAVFSTTVTGIPQPYAPKVGDPVATNITRTTATLSCTVSDAGNSTIDDSGIYYYKGGGWAGGIDDTDGSISGNISGLTPNTVYAMNGWAHNAAGYYGYSRSNVTQYDQTQLPSFTTSGNAPSISWGGMVAVGRKYAIGCWHVTYDTNASFGVISVNQYGTSTSYGSNATWGWDGTHNAIYYGGSSEANGTLQPNTTYYYKFQQTDSWNRASNVLTGSFTTSGNAPVISNFQAKNVARNSCWWDWSTSWDTNASRKTYTLVYGTTTNYGNIVTNQETYALQPNTKYYSKLTETDNWGRSTSATYEFTTPGNAPTVSLGELVVEADSVTINFDYVLETNATLDSFTIDYDTVQWGLNPSYANQVSNTKTIENLSPSTTYYYKINVKDNWGRIGYATGSFTTFAGDATGYVKGYVDGKGVVWQRGTVYIKVDGAWKKGRRVRKKTGGVWSESD
jgi:hypothetical protein